MSFYIRKSLRVGPVRFNLSGSGIGVSAGIKGLRVGTGPRGNYIHMGRGGLYFRQSLPSAPRSNANDDSPVPVGPPSVLHSPDGVSMVEIESGSVLEMVDSSAGELLREMNAKRQLMRIWPLLAAVVVCSLVAVGYSGLPWWAVVLVLVAGAGLVTIAHSWDELRKTTVMFYDLESEAAVAYQRLHDAFDALCASAAVWHVGAQGNVRDAKYHAGASTLVKRDSIRPNKNAIPFVRANVAVPTIPVGRQLLAFMPDRMLVFDPGGVGAVGYADLKFEVRQTRFIEDGTVPSDARVVDHTWRFVNKKGGPDRRFNNNRQLPIALYEEVQLSSSSGLGELLQVSRLGVADGFAEAVKVLAQEVARGPAAESSGSVGGSGS